jgi:uncharacterized protein
MADLLVLTGGPGHSHDFAATAGALADMLSEGGHTVDLLDDPDVAAERLRTMPYDALVVNALRWRMAEPAYDTWRAAWAYSTPAATRDAIAGFVADGGGLVGNHTASICFDDWPGWRDVLGGAWRWGHSGHPPYGPVEVTMVPPHPVVDGLPGVVRLDDEVYTDLDVLDAVRVLAHAAPAASGARPQPVVWAHTYGAGRVVYDGLGHDAASLEDPYHARLLGQAIAWVAQAGEAA